MPTILGDINKLIEEELLFEMSNLVPERTGLKHIIWVSTQTGRERHGPRVKLKIDHKWYSFSIEEYPKLFGKYQIPIGSKELSKVKQFISINRNILLEFWNAKGLMDPVEMIEKLEKIERLN